MLVSWRQVYIERPSTIKYSYTAIKKVQVSHITNNQFTFVDVSLISSYNEFLFRVLILSCGTVYNFIVFKKYTQAELKFQNRKKLFY